MKIAAIGLFAMLGLFPASVVAQNLITNGSFETPLAPAGNFTDFPVGSSAITGWSVFGPVGTVVSIVDGTFNQLGVTFPAQSGAQWLDLTGNGSNSTEGIQQTIATVPGRQYQLSFFVGNTTGGGIFGVTSTVEVLINGSATFTDANSAVNASSLTWQQFTHTFTASGSSTTIGFRNADPGSDNSNALDNVVLLDLGGAVVTTASDIPTLTEWALWLLIVALAGLSLARLRGRGAR